jgi:hypothetical protein
LSLISDLLLGYVSTPPSMISGRIGIKAYAKDVPSKISPITIIPKDLYHKSEIILVEI